MERRISKAFGTVRNSLSGSRSKAGTSSDTLHSKLYIECKRQKRIAVLKWMANAELKAKEEKKVPILALKGADKKGDYILVRLRDLEFVAIEKSQKGG